MDSGADESVWPEIMLPEEKVQPTQKQKKVIAKNGVEIKHYGEKKIKFRGARAEGPAVPSILFQVSDVTKPLSSVARIVEKGNVV